MAEGYISLRGERSPFEGSLVPLAAACVSRSLLRPHSGDISFCHYLQSAKFIGSDACLFKKSNEKPALHFASMVGNCQPRAIGAEEHDVASSLMINAKTCFSEFSYKFLGFDAAETTRHQAGTVTKTDSTTSWTSLGADLRCFLRLAQYARIASRTIFWASSSVSPCVMQPGREGTCATYPPSSAFSNTTVNLRTLDFMCNLSVTEKLEKRKSSGELEC